MMLALLSNSTMPVRRSDFLNVSFSSSRSLTVHPLYGIFLAILTIIIKSYIVVDKLYRYIKMLNSTSFGLISHF